MDLADWIILNYCYLADVIKTLMKSIFTLLLLCCLCSCSIQGKYPQDELDKQRLIRQMKRSSRKLSPLCYTPWVPVHRLADQALEEHIRYLKEEYKFSGPFYVNVDDVPPGYRPPSVIDGERVIPMDGSVKRNFRKEKRLTDIRVIISPEDSLTIRMVERFYKKKGRKLYVGLSEGLYTEVIWTRGEAEWNLKEIKHSGR